jgi:hypothetical protein
VSCADKFRAMAVLMSGGRSPYGRLRETLGLAPMRMVSVLTRLRSDPALSLLGDRPGILIVYAMPGDGVWLSGRPGGPA